MKSAARGGVLLVPHSSEQQQGRPGTGGDTELVAAISVAATAAGRDKQLQLNSPNEIRVVMAPGEGPQRTRAPLQVTG